MKSKFIILTLAVLFLSFGYAFAEDKKGSVKEEKVKEKNVEATTEAPKFCPLCGPEEELHALARLVHGERLRMRRSGAVDSGTSEPALSLVDEDC